MDVKLKSRREFIKLAGIAGIGLGAAACAVAAPAAPSPTPAHDDHSAAAATPEVTAAPVDMDAMHEAGVKKYLDNIGKDAKFYGNKLDPKNVDGVKEFNITCSEIKWDAGGGAMILLFPWQRRRNLTDPVVDHRGRAMRSAPGYLPAPPSASAGA